MQGFLREYAKSLQLDLSFQDFESELADPLGFYELVLLGDTAASPCAASTSSPVR